MPALPDWVEEWCDEEEARLDAIARDAARVGAGRQAGVGTGVQAGQGTCGKKYRDQGSSNFAVTLCY